MCWYHKQFNLKYLSNRDILKLNFCFYLNCLLKTIFLDNQLELDRSLICAIMEHCFSLFIIGYINPHLLPLIWHEWQIREINNLLEIFNTADFVPSYQSNMFSVQAYYSRFRRCIEDGLGSR